MVDTLTKVALLVLIVVEILVMLYLFYINVKKHQSEKKFWEKFSKELAESLGKYNDEYKKEHIENKDEKSQ